LNTELTLKPNCISDQPSYYILAIDYESHYNFSFTAAGKSLIICDFCINSPLCIDKTYWEGLCKCKKSRYLVIDYKSLLSELQMYEVL